MESWRKRLSSHFDKRSQTQAVKCIMRPQNFHGVSKSRENNEALVWTESQGSFGEFAKWSAVSRDVVWWPFKMVRGATKEPIPGRLCFFLADRWIVTKNVTIHGLTCQYFCAGCLGPFLSMTLIRSGLRWTPNPASLRAVGRCHAKTVRDEGAVYCRLRLSRRKGRPKRTRLYWIQQLQKPWTVTEFLQPCAAWRW